jgi:hypothetical protein
MPTSPPHNHLWCQLADLSLRIRDLPFLFAVMIRRGRGDTEPYAVPINMGNGIAAQILDGGYE